MINQNIPEALQILPKGMDLEKIASKGNDRTW